MNKKMTIVGALLMAVAVTGYSVSGTYAKYTGEVNLGSQTAAVAHFKVADDTNEIVLFDTTATGNMTDANKNVLKPGGEYSTDVEITDVVKSEVAYNVKFELTGSSISDGTTYDPMRYALVVKDASVDRWYTFAELKTAIADGTVAISENAAYTLHAKWSQDPTELGLTDDNAVNAEDNKLGSADTKAEVTIGLKATVTQKAEAGVTGLK